jgi:cytochrome c peroxidase
MKPGRSHVAALIVSSGLSLVSTTLGQTLPNLLPIPNSNGLLSTFNTNGPIPLNGPFFQSLGTNGRSCGSCHQPSDGWSVSAEHIRLRFDLTAGLDPIFRTVDGSNCDHDIKTATVNDRRQAYSLLTSKGLIRIALPVPANAEFDVVSVANPYGCNETATVSMYRRPLPTANLRFLSTLMWDGRESTPPSTVKITFATNPGDLLADLGHQAQDATSGHAQGAVPLTPQQQQQIVDFETGLFTAQILDYRAGLLNAGGATGGPKPLATDQFFVGINDPLGQNPTGAAFTPVIFNLFDAWLNSNQDARAQIARGQKLFNSKTINITGVAGLNDATGIPVFAGNCGTCHDTPNAGNHSVSAPLNIGVGDLTNSLGVSYLPVITLRNKTTKVTVQTTDPGRALITGAWADIGKLKGPILRGLSSRAPYFHNGSANTLLDAVNFYDTRFSIGFTPQEKADLVAFLGTL